MKVCIDKLTYLPISRICVTDNRKIDYFVKVGKRKKWVSKSYLVNCILSGYVENAKYSSNKVELISPTYNISKLTSSNIDLLLNFSRMYLQNFSISPSFDCNIPYETFASFLKTSISLLLSEDYYIITYGNCLVGLFVLEHDLGSPIAYLLYSLDYRNIPIYTDLLCLKVPDCVFYFEYSPIGLSSKYKELDFSSTLCPDTSYCISSGCYFTRGDIHCMRDYLESTYLPVKVPPLSPIVLKLVSSSYLSQACSTYYTSTFTGCWVRNHSFPTFAGFTYFNIDDLSSSSSFPCMYLIALCDDIIVGVLKLCVYSSGVIKHQSVAYIDIHYCFRRFGIANYMISRVDSYLLPHLPLYLSSESRIGKLCNLSSKFKHSVSKVPCKTYEDSLLNS